MNGYPPHGRTRPPQQNVPSSLLTDQENRSLYELLGRKCLSLATGVVQVYLTQGLGSGSKWRKRCTGACCFVKDNPKRSYYIRVYNIRNAKLVWEQELYNQFKYCTPRSYFHTFDTENGRAGLNFANETEAFKFKEVIGEKIRQKQEKKTERSGHHSTTSFYRGKDFSQPQSGSQLIPVRTTKE